MTVILAHPTHPGRRRYSDRNDDVLRDIPPVGGYHLVHCECGRPGCERPLLVFAAEHRFARHLDGSLVAESHVDPSAERVEWGRGEVTVVVSR